MIEPYYRGHARTEDATRSPARASWCVNIKSKEEVRPAVGRQAACSTAAIVGGAIDARFMPAILKGIMEKMDEGPLTGSYARDIRVVDLRRQDAPGRLERDLVQAGGPQRVQGGLHATPGRRSWSRSTTVEVLVPTRLHGRRDERPAEPPGDDRGHGVSDKGFERLVARVPLAETVPLLDDAQRR